MDERRKPDERGVIVVGVDGSEGSRAALEFALDDAVRRNARVRVVWAFPEPSYWATAYGMSEPMFEQMAADLEKAGRAMTESVVRERGGAVAAVPVTVSAPAGPPAKVLVKEAESADLLVVGHRGRGEFRSVVLGSVALQCVLHAAGPVTVVRAAARSEARDAVTAAAQA